MATTENVFGKYMDDQERFEETLEILQSRDELTYVVTKIGGVGDTFAVLPTIRALEANWAETDGLFIVDESLDARPLFSDEDFDLFEISRGTGVSGLWNQYRSMTETLTSTPDVYLDLTQSPRGYYYALFSGADLKIGYKWHSVHKWIMDVAVDRACTKFEGETFMDLARVLGVERSIVEPSYSPPETGYADYNDWKTENDLVGESIVLINPGASTVNKRWAEEKWSRLLDSLCSNFEHQFVVIEGPAEEGIVDRIRAGMNHPDSADRVFGNVNRPLTEIVHLVDDAGAIITNDTYLLHIGIVTGVPTFCVFNGKDPFRYRFQEGPHDCYYDLKTARPEVEPVQERTESWLNRVV